VGVLVGVDEVGRREGAAVGSHVGISVGAEEIGIRLSSTT
jgi:hypothetical protein